MVAWVVLMQIFGKDETNKLYVFANTFPLYFIYYLGCKAVGSIGYELWALDDWDQAYDEVQSQINIAKEDLKKRGFNFKVGLK